VTHEGHAHMFDLRAPRRRLRPNPVATVVAEGLPRLEAPAIQFELAELVLPREQLRPLDDACARDTLSHAADASASQETVADLKGVDAALLVRQVVDAHRLTDVRPTHRSAARLHPSRASSAASVCYAARSFQLE